MDSYSLLQGILPTQGSNLSLLLVGRFCTIWATREYQWLNNTLPTLRKWKKLTPANSPTFSFWSFENLFILYWVQQINNIVIASGRQRRGSAIHINVSTLPQAPLPSRLSRNIEQSSLCYRVGPCLLSIFKIYVFFKLKDGCFTEFCCFLSNLNMNQPSVQFSSVQSLSRVWLFVTPWTAARPSSSFSVLQFSRLQFLGHFSTWVSE